MKEKELDALLERVKQDWEGDPNVHTVWAGHKVRAGALVDGPTLCFGVRCKYVSEEEIIAAGSKPIPSEINGVQTDVYIFGGTDSYWAGMRGQLGLSPLKGGGSTGPLDSITPFPIKGGTLGGVCYYQDDRKMALSNAHVWGYSLGCEIVQPVKPVRKLIGSFVELLACGVVPAYIMEEAAPSGLTAILSGGAAVAWVLSTAADAKDPHRRGQEATIPAQPGELTKVETVKFSAQPKTLPLPGLPYKASVKWEYTRQTDRANYPFSVTETRMNEHGLVCHHVWTEEPVYNPGQTVKVKALIETHRKSRPDAFHVVAHLNPQLQKNRRITCVLHSAKFGEWPFLGVSLALGAADTPVPFPFQKNSFNFNANQAGTFRNWWPLGRPDGLVSLQFPDSGVVIDLPEKAECADLQVIALDPTAITLEAYDSMGASLDSVTTPPREGVQHLLKVRGPGIVQVKLSGGGGMGLLRWVSMKIPAMNQVQPLYTNTHVLLYEGKFTLGANDPRCPWQALLSAQSVSTLPPTIPPLKAAATIGGIEKTVLTTTKDPCTICLALDEVFKVI